MDRVISWRMKRPAYAPTTASSSPSRNRCRNRSRSPIVTRTHKTPWKNKMTRPREAKPFYAVKPIVFRGMQQVDVKHSRMPISTAAGGEAFYAARTPCRETRSNDCTLAHVRIERTMIKNAQAAGGEAFYADQMFGSRSKYSSSSFEPPSPLPSCFSDSTNSMRSIHLIIL
jgi:hypothetical protein